MKVYKFGKCYLNTSERRVVKNGEYVALTPKIFDVLEFLVKNSGVIVTKDEILAKVWNDSFVEEGNLVVHISKLRRLLSGDKNEPFIETVPGRGYRFVSTVKAVGDGKWKKHLPNKSRLQIDTDAGKFTFDSIAVLPFNNASRNAELDYLADELTENLINGLSCISGLKVIDRNTVFRYKNKDIDAHEVGKTLGVAAVLNGRIRVTKKSLMTGVELSKSADGAQVWGIRLDQPFLDIIEVQEKVAFKVSEKLHSEITGVLYANPPTERKRHCLPYL